MNLTICKTMALLLYKPVSFTIRNVKIVMKARKRCKHVREQEGNLDGIYIKSVSHGSIQEGP